MSPPEVEKTIREPSAGNQGLSAERAQQISIENQGTTGPTRGQRGTGTDDQISDCSKDNCTVNGQRYLNSMDIPGNGPKPLLHTDGTPVLDPDGKPLIGPESVDLEKVAQEAQSNFFAVPRAIYNFRHNGVWDFQRVMGDNLPGMGARPIFTQPYQNFANVAVGYVLGSLGMTANQIGFYGNTYCALRGCPYDEQLSQKFPKLADRQVKDFEIGLNLYNERHPQASEK
jgi:hypothetical protein